MRMTPPVAEGKELAHPDRKTIQSLFNAISSKYDFLNSFLSFGLHHYWRRKLVLSAFAPPLPLPKMGGGIEGGRILDLGVGTGKSLATFLQTHQFERAVGCDFSDKMLRKAKVRLGPSAELVACDFHELPFPDGTFDLVTGSFILRIVQNMSRFISEVGRVLSPNGRAVFLELTRPKNRFAWKFFYQPYLKFCIPSVGYLFTRHDHAYQFLSQSIEAFIEPEDLKKEFLSAGFREVSIKPLSFGSVAILQGKHRGAS